MKNKKFQFLAILIVSVMKAFTGQYALSPQIILVDESNYFKSVPHFTRNFSSEIDAYLKEVSDKKAIYSHFIYNKCQFKIIYSPMLIEDRYITDQSYFWDTNNKDRFIGQLCKTLKLNGLHPNTLPKFIKRTKWMTFDEKEYHGYLLKPLLILVDENNQYIKDPLLQIDDEMEEEECGLNSDNIYKEESFIYQGCNLKIILLKDLKESNPIALTSRYNFSNELNTIINEKVGSYNVDPLNLTKASANELHVFLINFKLSSYSIYAFALNNHSVILDRNKYFTDDSFNKETYTLDSDKIYFRKTFYYDNSEFEIIILKDPIMLTFTDRSCLSKAFNLEVGNIFKNLPLDASMSLFSTL